MGAREDAIDMVQTLGRADEVSLKFREHVGLDNGEEARYDGAEAIPFKGPQTSGLLLSDIDGLLHDREQRGWHAGYVKGCDDVSEALVRQHEAQLGEYVGGAFDLVSQVLLASIVTAAVKARREKRATLDGIVEAVIAAVKREAASLDDVAARARRGELFS